ncbi:helix-turn-helix domain-containing protein [Micromonospora echinaurantiaca]|uniref:helix-turn-helix domain-containing protein n=1 Tax=Micromonospora echinaurantiaca TaxID=47857 RepID=UPI000B5AFF22|nr:helix-turn-helix domain-containing protein [Micromonospora echinaurantiaca]
MIIIDGTEYMTAREAAAHLGLSVGTLRNQRSEARSPMTYIRQLGRVLYPVSEVERYAREIGR